MNLYTELENRPKKYYDSEKFLEDVFNITNDNYKNKTIEELKDIIREKINEHNEILKIATLNINNPDENYIKVIMNRADILTNTINSLNYILKQKKPIIIEEPPKKSKNDKYIYILKKIKKFHPDLYKSYSLEFNFE